MSAKIPPLRVVNNTLIVVCKELGIKDFEEDERDP